jgi:hypothetical protein
MPQLNESKGADYMRRILYVAFVSLSFIRLTGAIWASDTSKPALITRIQRADEDAILEAGNSGDSLYVPALEIQAGGRAADRRVIAAKMALAKLGIKSYLDETVAELTTTNSALFRSYRESDGFFGSPKADADRQAQYLTQEKAFEKLAYIKDRSTVKLIIPFLYAKENPEDYIHHGGFDMVVNQSPSESAMSALAQIVENPPVIHLPGNSDDHSVRLKAWQQWWQQNKDKYP